MNRWIIGAGLALAAGPATAAGIERSTQSTAILFEEGRYVEFAIARVMPEVSGHFDPAPGLQIGTGGNVLPAFTAASLAFKMPVAEAVDIALVLDTPVGADVAYPANGLYPINGTTANVDSTALTLMGRYRLPSEVSLLGGLRVMRTSGDVSLPVTTPFGVLPYQMRTSTETDWGWLLGIAYERRETGLRVALTYNSAIDHHFEAQEATALGRFDTRFTSRIPQSVNLEAQTGIAADTLLFGSIRWVDWSAFRIDPEAYRTANPANPMQMPLVYYDKDYVTYTLGLGRQFSERWGGAVTLAYEDKAQALASNLGPTNGYIAYGVALSFTEGPFEVTGLLRYYDFTSTDTDEIYARFTGNDAWAAGLRLAYRF